MGTMTLRCDGSLEYGGAQSAVTSILRSSSAASLPFMLQQDNSVSLDATAFLLTKRYSSANLAK